LAIVVPPVSESCWQTQPSPKATMAALYLKLALPSYTTRGDTIDQPIAASFEFVVHEQCKKVDWPKIVSPGLLRAHGKRVGHPAHA
jgi:hypothetical protein